MSTTQALLLKLHFRNLDEVVKDIENKKEEIDEFLDEILSSLQGLIDVLGSVGDVTEIIYGFFTTIGDLIYSDIFDGIEFNSFYDFFAGKNPT